MKRIPYCIEDFEHIIREDYYFIDHTRYIEYLENRASFILLLRPRRMGKTLFSNMMMAYYDMAKRDVFQELFGSLWIGKHPTTNANSYVVLKLDFSKVGGAENLDNLPKVFHCYCNEELERVIDYYGGFTARERERILGAVNAGQAIDNFTSIVKNKGWRPYLFIDEYDNFSNVVLTTRGVKAHEKITHGEGFYREFFKCCKGSFERIYMTGVAPVTYDDLTSGFNIATIISLEPKFNHILGITESELREMLEYYRGENAIELDVDFIINEMKPWYDNFCFSQRGYGIEDPIYNPAMVMNCLNYLINNDDLPSEMIDYNARVDYKKLNYLVKAEDLNNIRARFDILREICSKGYTDGSIVRQFPAKEVGDLANFKSMLFYFGALTFGEFDPNFGQKLIVTNKTMADLYLTYMRDHILEPNVVDNGLAIELHQAIKNAAVNGNWKPMIEKASDIFNSYSSVRNAIYGEPDAQGFLRGLLCLNSYFDLWPELELNQGFSDIMLIPKASEYCITKYSYIIELKYMKSGDKDINKAINDAKDQLHQYIEDIHLTASGLLRGTPCTLLYIIIQDRKFIKFDIA